MDMFMDKLAQRLTAQEIIKANTVAETEELNSLRSQVADYNDCLAKLQKLIDEGAAKLSCTQTVTVDGSEINRLVEESIGKIKALQQDTAGMDEIKAALTEQLEKLFAQQQSAMAEQAKVLEEQKASVEQVRSALAEQKTSVEQLQATLVEQLKSMEQSLAKTVESRPEVKLEERFDSVDENVHKECVKVYRNVQAVVVEESEKQKEALESTKERVGVLGGKLKLMVGLAAGTLAVSVIGLALQIIGMLNIKLF